MRRNIPDLHFQDYSTSHSYHLINGNSELYLPRPMMTWIASCNPTSQCKLFKVYNLENWKQLWTVGHFANRRAHLFKKGSEMKQKLPARGRGKTVFAYPSLQTLTISYLSLLNGIDFQGIQGESGISKYIVSPHPFSSPGHVKVHWLQV